MGFCIGSALCCAGQACCQMMCCCCSRSGVPSKNFARIGYVFFQIGWISYSIIVLFTAKKWVDWFPHFLQPSCPDQDASDMATACLGASNIIRMSLVLFVFHLFVFILILSRTQMAAAFHDGCWCTKCLLVFAGWIASMWIGTDFMQFYLIVCKWLSTFFLIYQGLLMLVVAYKINDTLVSNYQQDSGSCSGIILMGTTIFITGLNIYWIIQQYIDFSCYNYWIMSITVIGILMMYGLVLTRSRKDASVLTSSIAAFYCLYLQWSALSSDMSSQCNSNYDTASNTTAQILIGLSFTVVVLIIISGSTKSSDETNVSASVGAHIMEDDETVQDKEDVETGGKTAEENHVFAISSATITFQGLMVLSAMYMAMLCTNWAQPKILDENTVNFFAPNETSYWLKLVSQWLTMSIYIFSLIAPFLFPDRDFS